MEIIWWACYLLLGAITGFFAGLFGIGGGGIMVPVLTLLFASQGIDDTVIMHLALGTAMAAIVPTAVASTLAHQRRRGVDWRAVGQLTPGVLAGTFAATFLAAVVTAKPLAVFFAFFMTVMAAYMIWGRPPRPERQLPALPGMTGVGTGIGGISALVAIGGGSLTVPFLAWCNVSMPRAIGTSAAVGLPIAAAGAAGYIINGWHVATLPAHAWGFVLWPAVLAMAVMSFITAPLGARLAHTLPVKTLKRGFAVLMVLLAAKMLQGVW